MQWSPCGNDGLGGLRRALRQAQGERRQLSPGCEIPACRGGRVGGAARGALRRALRQAQGERSRVGPVRGEPFGTTMAVRSPFDFLRTNGQPRLCNGLPAGMTAWGAFDGPFDKLRVNGAGWGPFVVSPSAQLWLSVRPSISLRTNGQPRLCNGLPAGMTAWGPFDGPFDKLRVNGGS